MQSIQPGQAGMDEDETHDYNGYEIQIRCGHDVVLDRFTTRWAVQCSRPLSPVIEGGMIVDQLRRKDEALRQAQRYVDELRRHIPR